MEVIEPSLGVAKESSDLAFGWGRRDRNGVN